MPRRFLNGGHKQTLASHFLRRTIHLPLAEAREIETEPGTRLLVYCHWQPQPATRTTLLLLHGLEGSSDSGYILGAAQKALAAGMNVVRMNQRNCGGMDFASPTLYNSGLSGDIAAVVGELVTRDRLERMVLAGFSMGGNLVLKLVGEWGAGAPPQVCGAVAVSPALDLAASADALHEVRNRAYEWYFVRSLRARYARKVKLFPQTYDIGSLRGANSVREFDDKITAPYCGYGNADNYYATASASNFVDRIAMPTLVIHAADDPFIIITPHSRARLVANPSVCYVETKSGGHCAFLAEPSANSSPGDGNSKRYDGRWAERQIVEFAKQF